MNREHLFPEWLIRRTNTHVTGIKWAAGRRVSALSATLPLCIECNADFGRELESPVSVLFDDIEEGSGISDIEAELVIRWLWKIKGLAWIAAHPQYQYTRTYTLRDRVLRAIDVVRGQLILALALIRNVEPVHGDLPMGIDAVTEHDAIFVSGVFSRVAMIVSLCGFEHLIPQEFSRYRLAPQRSDDGVAKLFYPAASFDTDSEAVAVTREASVRLSEAHDAHAVALAARFGRRNAG
jgi:hypothetical protein